MYVSLKSFHQDKKHVHSLICKSFVEKVKLQFPKMSRSIKPDPVLLYIDETYRLLTQRLTAFMQDRAFEYQHKQIGILYIKGKYANKEYEQN